MAEKVLMIALSPTMETGTLVKWRKKVGDPVKSGDVLCEVETDKAVLEVPCPLTGRVTEVHVKQGDHVTVGQVLITVDEAATGAAAVAAAAIAFIAFGEEDVSFRDFDAIH